MRLLKKVRSLQKLKQTLDAEKAKQRSPESKWELWEPYPVQKQLLECKASLVGFGGSAGGSKAHCAILASYRAEHFLKHGSAPITIPAEIMSLETKILAPAGWVNLSDLTVGDRIMNPCGSPQRVLKIHELGDRPLYRVAFEDGTSTLASDDHLWGFWIARENSRAKSHRKTGGGVRALTGDWNQDYIVRARVENTLYLKEQVDKGRHVLTPICGPQLLTRGIGRGLKADPYLLGVMLGDGSMYSSTDMRFIKPLEDGAIAERIRRSGVELMEAHRDPAKEDYKPMGVWSLKEDEQLKAIASYGLAGKKSHEKFIPTWFLWASVDVRAELAKGLMDTDGTVGADGRHVSYTTVSPQLSEDVAHLIRSLGYRVTITRRDAGYKNADGDFVQCRDAYTLAIQGHDTSKLFSLPRKRDRCIPFNGGVSWPGKRIKSIELELTANARCITVSHPNRLYVTDDFIVTHNSTAGLFSAFLNHRKSLVLRKTYSNLKELIERSREMFGGSGGSYNGSDKLWRFPDGKLIEFGHVQYVKNKEDHKGREKDALIVDEVTELPGGWDTLTYLMGWVRSPIPSQTCQTIVTFNPPTQPSEEWIKDVFAPWINPDYDGEPADSGEIRWFATIDGVDTEVESSTPFKHGKELIEPVSRTFIRATLDDNLTLKNSDYRQRLKTLPEPLRSQLLYGDMSIQLDDNPWQIIPTEWVQEAMARWTDKATMPQTALGVDVARGGKDESIIIARNGNWFAKPIVFPGSSTPDGQSLATQVVKHSAPGSKKMIDVVGVGSSVYDILKADHNCVAISAGVRSHYVDKTRNFAFRNLRAELYWRLREGLDPASGNNWALPPDRKLKAELCAGQYQISRPSEYQQSLGVMYQITAESKDDIKERLGRSPDRADALSYAAHEESRKSMNFRPGGIRR